MATSVVNVMLMASHWQHYSCSFLMHTSINADYKVEETATSCFSKFSVWVNCQLNLLYHLERRMLNMLNKSAYRLINKVTSV